MSYDGTKKDIRRPLSALELLDIRHRENREGRPYSDRDMLLDHIELMSAEYERAIGAMFIHEIRAKVFL